MSKGPCVALGVLLVSGSFAAAETEIRGADRAVSVTPLVFDGDVRDLPRAREWRPGDPIRTQRAAWAGHGHEPQSESIMFRSLKPTLSSRSMSSAQPGHAPHLARSRFRSLKPTLASPSKSSGQVDGPVSRSR